MKSSKSHRSWLLSICLLCLLSLGTYAWAGPGGAEGPFGHDLFSAERLASDLELSDTQRAAVEQLLDDTRAKARPYVRTLMAQHKAMRAVGEADTFDEAAARSQAAQGAAAMTELAVIHARSGFELRKLLTVAQREKLHDMHGRHRRR